jgi:hypothetical protein
VANRFKRSNRLFWWVLRLRDAGIGCIVATVIADGAFNARAVGFAFLGLLGVLFVVAMVLLGIGYSVGTAELDRSVQEDLAEHERHRQERLAADRLRREQGGQQ